MSANKTAYGGGGGQISTPIWPHTEPGVSCAKIGNQTFYSDYPDQIQTYATDYAEDGATINVYHS